MDCYINFWTIYLKQLKLHRKHKLSKALTLQTYLVLWSSKVITQPWQMYFFLYFWRNFLAYCRNEVNGKFKPKHSVWSLIFVSVHMKTKVECIHRYINWPFHSQLNYSSVLAILWATYYHHKWHHYVIVTTNYPSLTRCYSLAPCRGSIVVENLLAHFSSSG